MNKRKTARIFNDLSMAFFLISSTVVAFLPIADREKHPAIAVLAGGIFWVGLLWGIFLYILSCQKIRNLKSYQNYRSVERIGALAPGSTKEGLIARSCFIPGIPGDHTRNLRVQHTGSRHVSLYVDNHGILLRTLRPERKGIQVFA